MDFSRFPDQHNHHPQQHYRRNIPPPPPPYHRHPPPPPPPHHRRISSPSQPHHFFEPRLPPPPLSSSYHHRLPPPPPYNPHQSQFTFRNPSPNPQFLDHFSDCRDACWDSSPRVFPENNQLIRAYPDSEPGHNQLIRAYPDSESGHNQLIKAYPEAMLGHESGYFAFDRNPVSDQFMHDSEGSSRFRGRISDEFVSKHTEEYSWDSAKDGDYGCDSHFVSNRDKDSGFGNFEVSDSNLSSRREVDENLGFKSRYGSNFHNELFRYERKDGVSVKERLGSSRLPMRNLPDSSFNVGNDDEARVFSGKRVTSFDRKGSRDRSQEYRRTPRKQIQKKSALLRIQMGKPKHRNKSDAQLQSFGHYDVSNSSSFRGKGPIISSNFRNKEEEREREGSPVELDVSFKSNLLVAKPVVTPPRPTTGFGKNSIPNSNRKNRKLTDSDTDNSSAPKVKFGEDCLKSEIFTQFCSSPSNCGQDGIRSDKKCAVSKTLFNGTEGPVSAEEGNNVKKKKVVKKAMICYSSSLDGPMKASSSSTHDPSAVSSYDKGLTQPIENITSAGEVSGSSADLQPSPNEVSMKLGSNKIEIDTVQLHAVSNSDSGQIEFQGDKNVHEIVREENISNQPSKNGISVALQYNMVRVNPQAMGLGYNLNISLSGSEGSKTYEAPVNSHSPGHVSNLGTDNAFVNCQENVSGFVTVDNDTSLPFLNQVTESHEHGLLGVSKIINMENPVDAVTSNHGAGTDLSYDYGLSNLQKKFGFPNIGSDSKDYFWKQPCPAHEHGSKEGSTTATVFFVDSGKEYFTNKIQEREHRSPQSNPLTLNQSDICVGTYVEVGSVDCLDINTSLDLSMEEFCDLQRKTSLEASSEEKISVGDGSNGSPIRFAHDSKKRKKLLTGLSSSTVSNIEELPATVDDYTSGAELRLNSNNSSTGMGEIALYDINTRCIGGLTNGHVGKSVLHEITTTRGSLGDFDAVKDKIMDGDLNLEQLNMDSGLVIKDTATMLSVSCPLGLENQQNENATSAIRVTEQQNVNIVMKNIREEADRHYTGEQVIFSGENVNCSVPFELLSSDSNETFCSSNMECDSSFKVSNDIPSIPNCAALSPYGDGDSITNVTDEGMDILYDMPSNVGSPEPLSLMSGEPKLCPKLSIDQISNEMVFGYAKKSDQEKSVINAGSEPVAEIDHLYTTKAVTLPAQTFKIKDNWQNSPNIEANKMKKQLSYAVPKMVPGRSSVFFTNSGKKASSVQNTKPSTWCRTVNTDARSPPLNQSLKKIERAQTSYIRKGNSIVRKPLLASALPQGLPPGLVTSVYRLKPSGIDKLKKSTVSDGRIGMPGPSIFSVTRGVNTASQKAQSITLPHSPEHVISGCRETTDPKLVEDTRSSEDAQKYIGISETKSGPVKHFDNQREYFDNSVSSSTSNIMYVKHKSNQLAASTGICNLSVKNAENTHVSSSGGYYKRKKNQLIRTTHEHPVNERVGDPVDGSNSKCQKTHKATFSRNFIKRWSNKGTCKPSESSLVWTLRGARSSKEVDNLMQHQRILPHLFPWKRTCWKKFKPNSTNMSSYSTSSVISKNLLLLRNRGAVYTRSSHGFSLRKSKVLSVGGRSLKWSVSIEKRSKKANEEATLAVAEAQRKKREANGAASVLHGAKIKKYSSSKLVLGIKLRPGERIYRIGSVRYKMDASKMTLQRISDDTSASAVQQDKDVNKSYVPRRLVIGNDEYVRIGNGNQLIRDPKKRTRTLASEKVRWSLHTARQRLAKKWKYCQFFTRFGKCNKENGKCPYIHDLSKVAVCTKFLKGLCSNDNCKLTHKVIPERMQDCSYFMLGLCSNESCPYRHVNVNPKSSTCEAFLRGYCAEGNECRKKHSYACPVFEASGLCPEGSKCKLHHPKKRSAKKKRRRLMDQGSVGRYFGSPQMDVSEGVVLDKYSTKNKDDLILADFISLEVSDEEIGENMDFTMSFDDGYSPDVEVDEDIDEMVKPIRLMNCSPL